MGSEPSKPLEPKDVHIGRKAVEMGLITANQLAEVLLQLTAPGVKEPPLLAPSLVSRGLLTEHQIGVLSDLVKGGPPREVGKYRVIRELGRGGMGVVYEATDPGLGRQVALKMLLLDFNLSPAERAVDEERFTREARLSANLPKHPHIVGVYEAGVADDGRFIAMEFVEGRQFAEWRKQKPLRLQIGVLRDVALAADHAHRHGVVHRDLKPANILVDAKSQPHVTDFGLAKRGQGEASLALTVSGAVMGTPAYMSPEQAEGRKDVDLRADVWALGVMLYEILTSRLPFEADSPLKWIMKTAKEPVPPPSSVVRGAARTSLDRTLEAVCMRALAKDPEARTPTARAFAAELTRWLKQEKSGPATVIPKKPAANPWVIGGIAAAVVAAVVIGLVAMSSPSAEDQASDRAREYVTQGQRLMQQGKYSDALIRFGQALAEEPGNRAAAAGKREAEQKLVSAGREKPAPPPPEDPEKKAREAAAAEEKELAALDAETRALREAGKYGEAREKITQASKRRDTLEWKDKVATRLETLRKTVEDLYGPVRREAAEAKQRGEAEAVEERKKRVAAWGWPGLAKDLEESLAKVPDPPPPAPRELLLPEMAPIKGHQNAVHSLAFTADGKGVVTASWDTTVRLWPLDTRQFRMLSEGSSPASVATSPDGRWVAVGYMDGKLRIWDGPKIWDAKPQVRIIPASGQQIPGLAFTPDSKSLLLACVEGGALRILDPATGGLRQQLEGHRDGAMGVAASPDGRHAVAGSGNSLVKIWDTISGREVGAFELGTNVAGYKMVFVGGGKSVIVGGTRGVLTRWDFEGARAIVFGQAAKDIKGMAVSPDGRWVVSTGPDGAFLWDAATGALRMKFTDDTGFFGAAFSPKGDLLVLGSGGWVLRLWDTSSLKTAK